MTTREHQARSACNPGPLVLVNGDKGGVGKSFMSRTLAWRLHAARNDLTLYDGDERNAHLDRFYGRQLNVTRFDSRSEAGWTELFNGLDRAFHRGAVLADLAAGVGQHLHREVVRLRSNELTDMQTVHVWVADNSEDSVRLFRDLREVAPASRTVFVMNKRDDDELKRFDIWLNSKARATFLADGGLEVSLPRLSPRVHDLIAANHLPFPDDRPPDWLRGDWFTFAAFRAAVDEELRQLVALIQEAQS